MCWEPLLVSHEKKIFLSKKKIAQISRPLFSNEKPDFVFEFSGKQITGWKNWDRQTFIEKPKKKKPKPSGDFFVIWRKSIMLKIVFLALKLKVPKFKSYKILSNFLDSKFKVIFWRQNKNFSAKF